MVACDETTDNKVKGKMKELVSLEPKLTRTFALFEMAMMVVEKLCSDDYRAQATRLQNKYKDWRERTDVQKFPHEVVEQFLTVMEEHETARQRVMKQMYQRMVEYDTIEHFLDKVSNSLEREIRKDLAGANRGIQKEMYTWKMVAP